MMKEDFRRLRLAQLDRDLTNLNAMPPRPADGWLASIREALDLSLDQVGKRLETPRQAIQRLEKYEAADRITLRNLRRVAEAMGCNLIYALVPKSGTFAELAEVPIRDAVTKDVDRVVQNMALEDQAPGNKQRMIEDEVKRRQNKKS